MGIVISGGDIVAGDAIRVELHSSHTCGWKWSDQQRAARVRSEHARRVGCCCLRLGGGLRVGSLAQHLLEDVVAAHLVHPARS